MKAWLGRLARLLRIRHPLRGLASRPGWFDATYLSLPEEQPARPQPVSERSLDERERAAVWRRARPIIGWDPEDWRVDHSGRPIFRHHFGDPQSSFGWNVALIRPDGGEDLANLRPVLCHDPERFPGRFERAIDMDRPDIDRFVR